MNLQDERQSQHTAYLLFATIIALSLAVLAGWQFNIAAFKTVIPGLISMKPNAAVGLLALAVAGLLLVQRPVSLTRRCFVNLIAVSVGLLAMLTLGQYMFGYDLKIDEFFFSDPEALKTLWPPGRFAPITGINFIMISVALLLDGSKNVRLSKVQQALLLVGWIVSFQAFIGYLAGISYSFGTAFYTQIAVHTAASFILLTSAILFSRPNGGFMRSVLELGIAGRVGRRLLAFAIFIPPAINLVQLYGVKAGFWNEDFGVLLRVCTNVVFFAWVAFQTSALLSASERDRNFAESERLKVMQRLEQAVKARDELLSVCSHEMRTPVTSMKLITQLTKREISKGDPKALAPENIKYVLDTSERQLDRLTKLIEEILDFSRIVAGKLNLSVEDVNLSQLVTEVTERFRPVFDAAICKVETHIAANVQGHWDRYRVEQVISNLLSNSAKYGAGQPIVVTLAFDGPNICISVRNQGAGIAAHDQVRIFEPYERAVSVSNISGLGMGLYIARQIVEAHGGSISVDSHPGQGANFSVVLPIATPNPGMMLN